MHNGHRIDVCRIGVREYYKKDSSMIITLTCKVLTRVIIVLVLIVVDVLLAV